MPEMTVANTRNGELRQEMDELRQQVRVQGDTMGEIRQLLVVSTNPALQGVGEEVIGYTMKNGGNYDQGNQENHENPNC